MKTLRIVVAGGRDFNDYDLMKKTINETLEPFKRHFNFEFISGKAKGADTLGERYAKEYGYIQHEFPADWSKGKYAGLMRNEQMAKFAVSDKCTGLLFAFWDGNSRGTKNMIDNADKYELCVKVVNYGRNN